MNTGKTFIDIGNIDFFCPYCKLLYSDIDEKILHRLNKNKNGYTKQKCICGKVFGVSADMSGDMVSFIL